MKCKQKDKLKTKCDVCGMAILLAPHMEARRGHVCPNCFRKKQNLERFGMEEPPKNVGKEALLRFKSEMELLKDLPIEEYKKVFEEKINFLKANTAQALHLLEGHEHMKKKARKKLRLAGELIKYPETCSSYNPERLENRLKSMEDKKIQKKEKKRIKNQQKIVQRLDTIEKK